MHLGFNKDEPLSCFVEKLKRIHPHLLEKAGQVQYLMPNSVLFPNPPYGRGSQTTIPEVSSAIFLLTIGKLADDKAVIQAGKELLTTATRKQKSQIEGESVNLFLHRELEDTMGMEAKVDRALKEAQRQGIRFP